MSAALVDTCYVHYLFYIFFWYYWKLLLEKYEITCFVIILEECFGVPDEPEIWTGFACLNLQEQFI